MQDYNYLFGYAAFAAPFVANNRRDVDFFSLPEDVRAAVEEHKDDLHSEEDLSSFVNAYQKRK